MSTAARALPSAGEVAQIRTLARPLVGLPDLDPLVQAGGDARFVCLGEASHGTHEFYSWRAALSRRLVEERGFRWIGVEGDWPDCWRINRWVQGREHQDLTAEQVLAEFERWPTWMWANREVAEFLTWLRAWNQRRPESDRVAFYGLDVYSLWDSLRVAISWVEAHAPDALPSAMQAWQCLLPYGEDPQRYAAGTRLVPASCEDDVVALLLQIRRRTRDALGDDAAFDAAQNAEVAAGAEHYYRLMVRGDQASWNLRDTHMVDTVDRIARRTGPGSKGLVWAHNTHVGDARATDMAQAHLVNVGQLVRERHGADGVLLVGFAAHRGTVLAAAGWGRPEHVLPVPIARAGSHEHALHESLRGPAVLVFGEDRSGPWLTARRGHRAIGVVYDPGREYGNYVPTVMGGRYDALVWLEHTTALRALHHELPPREPELETEPSGY
jgi:erythromycin esterase-like protein